MIEPNIPVFELVSYGLEHAGITHVEAMELFKSGFLSFDPSSKTELAGYDLEELAFLKKLYFKSGLGRLAVTSMLDKLKKPYRYSFHKIYWDFGSENWKEINLILS